MNFDFHRLNVLLLRSTGDKSSSYSSANLKLATATLSGARIDAVLEDSLKLNVVLGGLQVCDLLSGHALQNRMNNNTNNYVVNVGLNPDCEDQIANLGRNLYHANDENEEDSAALVLHIVREYPETVDWTSTIKRGSHIKKKVRLLKDINISLVQIFRTLWGPNSGLSFSKLRKSRPLEKIALRC